MNKACKDILKKFKKIDVLINNTSIDYKPTKKIKSRKVFDISILNWKKNYQLD